MAKKKSWAEKRDTGEEPVVKPAPADMAGMKAGEIMLIPTPRIIDDFIRAIPKGTSIDVKTLRKTLAKQYEAEVACPITTGIFLRIVAEAAFEDYEQGTPLTAVTPVWRVLDNKTPTTKKLSCGTAFITEQRTREGLAP